MCCLRVGRASAVMLLMAVVCCSLGCGARPSPVGSVPSAPTVRQTAPKDLIVGTWEAQAKSFAADFDFKADGSVTLSVPGSDEKRTGTYRLTADNVLEIKWDKPKFEQQYQIEFKTLDPRESRYTEVMYLVDLKTKEKLGLGRSR